MKQSKPAIPPASYRDEGEHPCEALIRTIQSREGSPSKEERERAFVALLEMYRKGIYTISWSVWRRYRFTIQQPFETFHHDTVTTLIELVSTDYIPKKYGGAAMFTPYFQTKLYYRTLDRAQKLAKLYSREESSKSLNGLHFYTSDFGSQITERSGVYDKEESRALLHATYMAIVGSAEETHNQYENNELRRRIEKLREIAKMTLSAAHYEIWELIIFSEWTTGEIAHKIKSTRQVVYSTYKKVRKSVLAAYAEQHLAGLL